MPGTVSSNTQPVNGRKTSGATASLLTQVTSQTTNTVFTASTIVRAGWDLSGVSQGMVVKVIDAVSGREYRAQIRSVDDGNDEITIRGWRVSGADGIGKAAMVPAAGSDVFVLKTDKCQRLLVDALDANSGDVYIGFEDSVTVDGGANPGHPIASAAAQPNHRFECEVDAPQVIDLANVWVISAASQGVSWVAS